MNAPLLNELLKYHEEKNLILSMPGNKCGKGFSKDELGKRFADNMGYLDITEVEPLDNLHCPEGIIKEAQELLAETYKAKKAYFLVNGSSSGNMAAIFSAFNEGDEVIVERNCHKSIYNGLILRKLKVSYIEPIIDNGNGIFLPPNKRSIYEAISKCENPKGIILTYPNYFGITYDIEEIIIDLKKKGLKTIIDCAHGAHFVANDKLPKNISSIADYIVLSAHKTLPALTQGAYFLSNDENNEFLEFYIRTFMTTSPSYLIMASLDYSRYYLDNYGQEDYEALIERAEKWKKDINSLSKVQILSKDDLIKSVKMHEKDSEKYDIDLSRYLIVVPNGYSGHKLLDYLRKEKIQCEMSFSRGIVLILSPFNDDNDFENIFNAFKKLDLNEIKGDYECDYYSHIPKKVLEPYEVFSLKDELIDIEDCEGKVSKKSIIPYPPGIPLVCPGEVISSEALKIINNYLVNKKNVIGIEDGKISIVKIN